MKYRILTHVDVEAQNEQEALLFAKKMGELLKSPIVRMTIASEGIRLANGDPVVYNPKPVL